MKIKFKRVVIGFLLLNLVFFPSVGLYIKKNAKKLLRNVEKLKSPKAIKTVLSLRPDLSLLLSKKVCDGHEQELIPFPKALSVFQEAIFATVSNSNLLITASASWNLLTNTGVF